MSPVFPSSSPALDLFATLNPLSAAFCPDRSRADMPPRAVSPLCTAFAPNRPLTPLSTAFTQNTGYLGSDQRLLDILRTLFVLSQIPCFQQFAGSLSLLSLFLHAPILCFQLLAASFAKIPGWGCPSATLPRSDIQTFRRSDPQTWIGLSRATPEYASYIAERSVRIAASASRTLSAECTGKTRGLNWRRALPIPSFSLSIPCSVWATGSAKNGPS